MNFFATLIGWVVIALFSVYALLTLVYDLGVLWQYRWSVWASVKSKFHTLKKGKK